MKKIGIFLVIALCLTWMIPAAAQAEDVSGLLAAHALAEGGDYSGTAKAAVLYELNTGTLVYAHQPDLRLNPTGIVKVLTALIVLEEGNLEDVVTVRRSTLDSVGIGAVSAGLQPGEEMTLGDLLRCIMVSSANDACAVAAEHIAGSQEAFVEKMNSRAATLGCVNTHFTNVHGLMDEGQYSTARDLAIITAEALRNPEFTQLFGLAGCTVSATNKSAARQLVTTNKMMDPDSPYYDARVTGGKPAAATTKDRSLVCAAQVEGSRYLCVVMSAQAKMSGGAVSSFTNFKEAEALLDMGFENYAVQQVLGSGQPFGLYPVRDGENHVVVGTDEQVFALLPIGFEQEKLSFEELMDADALTAPVRAGQTVGTLQIRYNGVVIGKADLLARHDVAVDGSVIQTPAPGGEGGGISIRTIVLFGVILAAAAAAIFIGYRRTAAKRRRSARKERVRGRNQ